LKADLGLDQGPWVLPRENFWRARGIVCLLEYPEKTDRLEQRQAAGFNPQRSFFVCAVKSIAASLFSASN